MKKRVVFRCDGGALPELGTGHVVRCMALAKILLKEPSNEVAFLVKASPEIILRLKKEGFLFYEIKAGGDVEYETFCCLNDFKPDIVVLDRLSNDPDYIRLLKKTGCVVIAIDDISAADNAMVDITINPILFNGKGMYEGMEYMVLPDADATPLQIIKDKPIVFVCFGGYDHSGLTNGFVDKLMLMNDDRYDFVIVVGDEYPEFERLQENKKSNVKYFQQPRNFVELLASADVAILSGGLVLYQAAYFGVPSICLAQYAHQEDNAKSLALHNVAISIGKGREMLDGVFSALLELGENAALRAKMSEAGRLLFSGKGSAEVAEIVQVIQPLKWDTDFFDLNIASLRTGRLRESVLKFAFSKCAEEKVDCLYYLCDCHDRQSVKLAELFGFDFVDVRITFSTTVCQGQRTVLDEQKEKIISVRPAEARDINCLLRIAGDSYKHSRYFFDGRFPLAKCKQFYQDWISKSVTGGFDDIVLVAEINEVVVGYISCKRDTRNSGRIGLVGVDKGFQGKGVGFKLIDAALKWFADIGVPKVSVVTQGRNIAAQRLYQRCGFITDKTEVWYHKWFERNYSPIVKQKGVYA